MNIGVFYQSGYKFTACYIAIYQLRKYYPNIPIALFEDGSDVLKPIADKFFCDYKKTKINGCNGHLFGRPVVDLESNLSWLARIYEACNSTLKNNDYFILYEDDVWCLRQIKKHPIFDLAGSNGPIYNHELSQYLFNRFNTNKEERNHWSPKGTLESYQACGGTIVDRLKFMEAYERLNEIDWLLIKSFDSRPTEWSDAALSFVMQHAGFTCGRWHDWGTYDLKNDGNLHDKTGWSLSCRQEFCDFAFIHNYKHYYNYTAEELELAKAKILCEENGFSVIYNQ